MPCMCGDLYCHSCGPAQEGKAVEYLLYTGALYFDADLLTVRPCEALLRVLGLFTRN